MRDLRWLRDQVFYREAVRLRDEQRSVWAGQSIVNVVSFDQYRREHPQVHRPIDKPTKPAA